MADIDRELLDVALNEFLKTGYGGTSMANIVKAAGVSKTTLYSRYSSKQELFVAIIGKIYESNRVVERMKEWQSSLSLEEGIEAYARRVLEIGMNDIVAGIDRLIFSESHHFPELAEAAGDLYDQLLETLSAFVAESSKHEGKPCRHPERLAAAVIDLTRGYHVRAMVTNRVPEPAEIDEWIGRTMSLLLDSREVL